MVMLYIGGYRGGVGASLRGDYDGNCVPSQVMTALQPLFLLGVSCLWIDCHYLTSLPACGQQLLRTTTEQARAKGLQLHWCGLSDDLLTALHASPLSASLSLLPTTAYQGPLTLAQEQIPVIAQLYAFC